jgi:nucleoside-diphosphate-sugar epimerase
VVNVGAGDRTSLNQLLQMVREVSGTPVPVEYRPPRAGDVRDSLAGMDRAREVLGYEPDVTLAEGLRLTWEWMRARVPVPAAAPA